MESNSSKSEWPGQQHVAMLANTGFCYTGQDKIVKCAECKVYVNMKETGVITLNEHHSNCKIAQRLRDVISLDNVQSNQNGSNERKRKSTFCPEVNELLKNSNLDSTKLGDQTISQTQNSLTQNSTSFRQLGVDHRGTDTLVEQRSLGQKDASKDERIHGQNSSSIEQSPSTEGRDASVLECSVGQNLFRKSDVPKLEHPFEPENTSLVHDNLFEQCVESINSPLVTNNESRQHNPLTLENDVLEQALQFKQDGSVVQQSTINAKEISRPTANTFDENHRSTSVLESLLENQDPSIKKNVRKDLTQYTTYESIKRAPSSRYHPSNRRRCNESGFVRYRRHDMYGCPIISEKTLVLKMEQRVQSGPLHTEFKVVKDRRRSFEENGINNGNTALQAEAGFYCTGGSNGTICCFYCDLGLREELLAGSPWREHARWYPVCPYVIERKGFGFIDNVIVATGIMKDYLRDKHRYRPLSTDMIVDALRHYPPSIVDSTIQGFVLDNGFFPGRDDLFHALETIKLWKTLKTYEYCKEE